MKSAGDSRRPRCNVTSWNRRAVIFLTISTFKGGYTRKILERWKEPVRACSKGLVEGFFVPEPTYRFDHSHAWGGTPLYSLPKALLGLEITEAGMRSLTLSPSLMGLSSATVELMTPHGKLTCRMQENGRTEITCPDPIALSVAQKNGIIIKRG